MFTGEQIRKARKDKKLSVKELSELLDVREESLYKWEKGTKPNNVEDYRKIEGWLGGKMEIIPENAVKAANAGDEDDLRIAVRKLSEATERHSIIDERNSRNIERLIALLEIKYGVNSHKQSSEKGASVDEEYEVSSPSVKELKESGRTGTFVTTGHKGPTGNSKA